jgi:transcriptional regulator with XRE-family HTH domain
MDTIGGRVKALRLLRKWNQQQLGEMAGTTSQTVSNIERGATEASKLLPELARALGTSAEYLRYGDAGRPAHLDDLDRINEIIMNGRLPPKTVRALRNLAENLAD